MRRREVPDDDPTMRPPSGARVREVRSRDATDATDATNATNATEVPLMSELRTKRASGDPLDTPAAAEALRPARLPRDAEELLHASSVPPEPAPARREPGPALRPVSPASPASPAARAVLLVLGGVLAMWVLAMVVLAVLHYAR